MGKSFIYESCTIIFDESSASDIIPTSQHLEKAGISNTLSGIGMKQHILKKKDCCIDDVTRG